MAVRGVDATVRRLQNLQNIKRDLVDLIDDTLTDVEIGAIRDAPTGISQRIQKKVTNGGLQGEIEVNAGKIAAYIEFGTGQSAAALVPTLPDDWQAIARSFYVNGQGRLIANPYLYPNWFRYTNGFEQKVKDIVKRYE